MLGLVLVVYTLTGPIIDENKKSLALLPIYMSLWFGIHVLAALSERVLRRLHLFFDEDGCVGEKEYGDGYRAWSWIIISAGYLFLAFSRVLVGGSYSALGIGYYGILTQATAEFASRKGSSRPKDKSRVTEALRKLLERCRSWLPKPVPVPS